MKKDIVEIDVNSLRVIDVPNRFAPRRGPLAGCNCGVCDTCKERTRKRIWRFLRNPLKRQG